MKITKWVEMAQEFEIEISAEDCLFALMSLPEPDELRFAVGGVNTCIGFLQKIPNAVIERMTVGQHAAIQQALSIEMMRYIK